MNCYPCTGYDMLLTFRKKITPWYPKQLPDDEFTRDPWLLGDDHNAKPELPGVFGTSFEIFLIKLVAPTILGILYI